VLLLRRSDRAAFVPGGYVFPGGLLEPADASPEATGLIGGISAEAVADRMRLRGADPPATAYVVAAVRETFEEAGLLVGVHLDEGRGERALELRHELREDLLEGRIGFTDVLTRLGARIASDELAYFAHWITPEAAPRRYDTRFFAAEAFSDFQPILDTREMTDAMWITPRAALQAFAAGAMKMILPTIETLESLATFASAQAALGAMRTAEVTTTLPTSEVGGFAARSEKRRLAEP
jgi:8-oxo-dGTP pyrophosphatase MutT (NUDIX family)